MSDSIRAAVESIMAQHHVTFECAYRGVKKRALDGASDMDQWECAFVRTNPDGDKTEESFEFFTGFGLRAEPTPGDKRQARFEFPGLTENDISRRTNYGRRYLARVEELRKPKAPHPADVLYSLVLDSSAAGQSFEFWCQELGYDSDSRKAFRIYEACQQNADKLARIFGQAEIGAISEALQDY